MYSTIYEKKMDYETPLTQYYSTRGQTTTSSGYQLEPVYTLSTMADPYALQIERIKYLQSVAQKVNNGNIPKAKIMKYTGLNPDYERSNYGGFNAGNERFTAEEFKELGDMMWKGLSTFSRFYAEQKLTPAQIGKIDSVNTRFQNGGYPGRSQTSRSSVYDENYSMTDIEDYQHRINQSLQDMMDHKLLEDPDKPAVRITGDGGNALLPDGSQTDGSQTDRSAKTDQTWTAADPRNLNYDDFIVKRNTPTGGNNIIDSGQRFDETPGTSRIVAKYTQDSIQQQQTQLTPFHHQVMNRYEAPEAVIKWNQFTKRDPPYIDPFTPSGAPVRDTTYDLD